MFRAVRPWFWSRRPGIQRRPAAPVLRGCEPLERRVLLASASLVKDIFTGDPASNPGDFTDVNGTSYFSAASLRPEAPAGAEDLWKTDGTTGGTVPVKGFDGALSDLENLNGTLYFVNSADRDVWKSDGTAEGTVSLGDLPASTVSPVELTVVGDAVYFMHYATSSSARGIYQIAPGGPGGEAPRLVVPLSSESTFNIVSPMLTRAGNSLYFTATGSGLGRYLWKTDGTQAGTVQITNLFGQASGTPTVLTAGPANSLFFVSNQDVWLTDGTREGTRMALDVPVPFGPAPRLEMAYAGGFAYVTVVGTTFDLYKTDGTAATAVRVKRIDPGTFNGAASNIAPGPNGTVLFAGPDASRTTEPWASDGTEAGTRMLADVAPAGYPADPAGFVTVGSRAFFAAGNTSGNTGRELWATDGTPEGTALVKDIFPGFWLSNPTHLTHLGADKLIFSANAGNERTEPWVSDGTEAGTRLLKNIHSEPSSSNPNQLFEVNGRVVFNASFQSNSGFPPAPVRSDLWSTDGTAAGTRLIDFNQIVGDPGAPGGGARAAVFQGRLFFGGALNNNLWSTAGTGTGRGEENAGTFPSDLFALGDSLYYVGGLPNQRGLYRAAGGGPTSPTRSIGLVAFPGNAAPTGLTALGASLLFKAGDALWHSDGNYTGTIPLTTFPAGSHLSTPAVLNGRAYFTAADGHGSTAAGDDLWVSDGRPGTTSKVKDLPPGTSVDLASVRVTGGALYFLTGDGLWRSDGTEGGTRLLKAGVAFDSPFELGGYVYFVGSGDALWRTDGTPDGTVPVATVSNAGPAVVVGDRAYFAASPPPGGAASGRELWVTDGTAAGTVPVTDINPGPGDSNPLWLTPMGGTIYFSAYDPEVGTELWKYAPDPAPPLAPRDFSAVAISGGEIELAWVDASRVETSYRIDRSTDPTFARVDKAAGLPAGTTRHTDTDLAPGTRYYYRVVAAGPSGDSAPALADVTTQASPAAPTGLTARATSPFAVRLSWNDASADETGFRVERSRFADFRSVDAVHTTPPNTRAYDDADVSPHTTYYYRVRSVGPGGISGAGLAEATTPDGPAANLRAVGVSASSADVFWQDNALTETGFQLQIQRGPDQPFTTVVNLPSNTTSYTHSTVDFPGVVRYRVRAVASGEAGGFSNVATLERSGGDLSAEVFRLPSLFDRSPASAPAHFTAGPGGFTYFTAAVPGQGNGIWRTDGTAAGTAFVADIPGPGEDSVTSINRVADVLYLAVGSLGSQRLVRTDGTAAGTIPLPVEGYARDFVAYNGLVYFRVFFSTVSDALWVTDGTAAGTRPVKTVWDNPGFYAYPAGTVEYRGHLYFGELGLWRSDGTANGTQLVTGNFFGPGHPQQPRGLFTLGDSLYFFASDTSSGQAVSRLWRTDGTAAGTVVVTDGVSAAPVTTGRTDSPAAADTVYFLGGAAGSGSALTLWKTDGTAAGTVPVNSQTFVSSLVRSADGRLHYVTHDYSGPSGTARSRVFVEDGSGAAPTLLFDTTTMPFERRIEELAYFGGRLYFSAYSAESGWAVYQSDGTAAGTAPLRSFPGTIKPGNYSSVGGRLHFRADDGVHGSEPWVTDGTPAGTVLLKDLANATAPGRPDWITPGGDGSFFFTSSHAQPSNPSVPWVGIELWKTAAGGGPGATRVHSGIKYERLFRAGGNVFFAGTDPQHGTELWISDGTAGGTVLVKDFVSGVDSSEIVPLADLGGRLVFAQRRAGTFAYELWGSDGTADGTTSLGTFTSSIPAPLAGEMPRVDMAVAGLTMYFTRNTTAEGAELWRTDGTPGGTRLVLDIVTGTSSSAPRSLLAAGDRLFFLAHDTFSGTSLWTSDGTAAGTAMVHDPDPARTNAALTGMTAVGSRVGYVFTPVQTGTTPPPAQLWFSDGTGAGTTMVRGDFHAGGAGVLNASLAAAGDVLVFATYVPTNFSRGLLWRSDGTAAGTFPLRSAPVNVATIPMFSAARRAAVVLGGKLYFTDGSPGGTRETTTLYDASALPGGATPVTIHRWAVDGDRVLAAAYDRSTAQYALRLASASAPTEPSGAVGTQQTEHGVLVTWQRSDPDTAGFVIERAAGGDFSTIDGVFVAPGAATAHLDATATPGVAYVYRVRAVSAGGSSEAVASGSITPAGVVARSVLYYRGAFAGDAAIAPDKTALPPGAFPSFANVTSFTRGLNGIVLDLSGIPAGAVLSAADFHFRYGRGGNPVDWAGAPAPREITVRRGAGLRGSDRVTIMWGDDAVKNAWLQVTALANERTGLPRDDVFAFGNLVGETGDAAGWRTVGTADAMRVRAKQSARPAGISNAFDFNRDGRVNSLDVATARANQRRALGTPAVPVVAAPPPRRPPPARRTAEDVLDPTQSA